MNLKEYLGEIESCHDPFKLREMGIWDNHPILLYGNKLELFADLTDFFNEKWIPLGVSWNGMLREGVPFPSGDELEGFLSGYYAGRSSLAYSHPLDYVNMSIRDHVDFSYRDEEKDQGFKVHAVHMMLHPGKAFHGKGIGDIVNKGDFHWLDAIGFAISEIGNYVFEKNLSVRFPNTGKFKNHEFLKGMVCNLPGEIK